MVDRRMAPGLSFMGKVVKSYAKNLNYKTLPEIRDFNALCDVSFVELFRSQRSADRVVGFSRAPQLPRAFVPASSRFKGFQHVSALPWRLLARDTRLRRDTIAFQRFAARFAAVSLKPDSGLGEDVPPRH